MFSPKTLGTRHSGTPQNPSTEQGLRDKIIISTRIASLVIMYDGGPGGFGVAMTVDEPNDGRGNESASPQEAWFDSGARPAGQTAPRTYGSYHIPSWHGGRNGLNLRRRIRPNSAQRVYPNYEMNILRLIE